MDYQKLKDTRNSTNPFAQRLGIFVEEIGPGYARAVKDVTPPWVAKLYRLTKQSSR